jgi:hypothetical protein
LYDRLAGQYQKAVSEVNETYQFYVSMLEERRAEITRYAFVPIWIGILDLDNSVKSPNFVTFFAQNNFFLRKTLG